MKLSQIKNQLHVLENVDFKLPNGTFVPAHFHVTEIGLINKKFIDCGGVVREETMANFQLWDANDFDHRLKPAKLLSIIELSQNVLGIEDPEVEVEFQAETIGRYGLTFNGHEFELTTKQTDCLAADKCGIPNEKLKVKLSKLTPSDAACCTPGGGCC